MSSSLRALRRLAISMCLALAVAALARAAEGDGSIAGQVLDSASGSPLEGVIVRVTGGPSPETRTSGADGGWEVTGLPAGEYTIRFEKPGFKPAVVNRFAVRPSESSRADLSLSPAPPDEPAIPGGVEEFVVVGTKAEAIEASRADSDQLLNTLSAEEFSKFAASDVADALKFVPGVNVVKGQFAIIRGLEDRYSSTLYNGAPLPSPDPDRQSIPLDLFPSEVVTNLVVAKTFAPDLPSNSSGGSIDIITHDYPEELEIKATAGVSINSNAKDSFWNFDSGSSVGRESSGYGGVLGDEFGLSIAGRSEPMERELRYKLVLNQEIESNTAVGFQEVREPEQRNVPRHVDGGLSTGELNLSKGRFDLTDSEDSKQILGYGGFGIDLDQQGNHKLDLSLFYTKKQNTTVEVRQNGFIPGMDYGVFNNGNEINAAAFTGFATANSWIAQDIRTQLDEPPSRGHNWYTSTGRSTSFDTDRDLLVTQLNGDHTVEGIEGLHLGWAANYAKTTQDEQTLGTRVFFEPDDDFAIPARVPPSLESLGSGSFASPPGGIIFSTVNIDEHQYFARLDADYQLDLADGVTLKLDLGGWYEDAARAADAGFLQTPQVHFGQCQPDCVGDGTQFAFLGDTANELGHNVFANLARDAHGDYASLRQTTTDSSRKVTAGDFGLKATLWDDVDLLGGLRLERLILESNNDPFIGGPPSPINGAPVTYPTAFLMFDRLDNPALFEVSAPPPPGTVFNDELLGIKVPVNPATGTVDLLTRQSIESLVNGRIAETNLYPAFGAAYRPLDGLAFRAAFSQTAARPSFREMSYYVTVEPGDDDLLVGNPQLQTSDVESYDLRGEYTWGDVGDLFAVSGFYKRIDDPIESLVIRDPTNFDISNAAEFRTFFNNPNVARLWGIELEGRKNLEFLGVDAARYFSLGANFTYIHAEVGRTQAELQRSLSFNGVDAGNTASFQGLKQTRRLFGQPEWIANADLSFDQPDWGTKVTLAFFAISDILDAAGTASIGADNRVYALTLDRYVDSFSRLDLIVTQIVHADFLGSDLTFKISGKNLTDTTRRLIYDPGQTSVRIPERSYKLGRDFKFTITWAF